MWSKVLIYSVIFSVFTCNANAQSVKTIKVPVLIAADVKEQMVRLSKQTDILTITDFTNLPQGRDLVDVILLNQALHFGHCNCQLEYFDNSVYGRNIGLLKTGEFAMSADTLWLADINRHLNDLVATDAIINKGTYDVGLYTASTNKKALSSEDHFDLSRLTAVSNRFWSADWLTVKQLNPSKLAHIESFENMKRLVKSEIADYTLMHFRINDNQLDFENLTPIPNIKAILWDSRHFAVSKNYPHAAHLLGAINTGLQLLRRKNRIAEAYQAVGINHPLTHKWKVINDIPTPTSVAQD